MEINKILSGSLTGTSAMTLLSYLLSKKFNQQFKEPELLNKLLSDNRLFRYLNKNSVPGWLIHYLMGTLFTTSSHFIWKTTKVNPTMKNGAFLGLMYGLIGIVGWHLIFKLHPNPPSVNLQKYYLHLLAAHLFFGCGTSLGYKHFRNRNLLPNI